MPAIAIPLATALLLLAALHLSWMIRGVGTGAGVPSRPDGTPAMRPGRVASGLVALALALAALLALGNAGIVDVGLPPLVVRSGAWGVAITFAARTVGDFRYVGIFKRVRGTPFARRDTLVYTPLCGVLASAAFAVAASPVGIH